MLEGRQQQRARCADGLATRARVDSIVWESIEGTGREIAATAASAAERPFYG